MRLTRNEGLISEDPRPNVNAIPNAAASLDEVALIRSFLMLSCLSIY